MTNLFLNNLKNAREMKDFDVPVYFCFDEQTGLPNTLNNALKNIPDHKLYNLIKKTIEEEIEVNNEEYSTKVFSVIYNMHNNCVYYLIDEIDKSGEEETTEEIYEKYEESVVYAQNLTHLDCSEYGLQVIQDRKVILTVANW